METGTSKIYPEKKVTLYIDAANLILTARDFGMVYNIYWVLEYFKFRYKVNKVVYFTGEIEALKEDYFFLRNLGVEVIFKKIYREEDGKIKANCDVEISHRITFDLEYDLVDKVILMTGDGDFLSLLNYVRTKNKEVKLMGIHRRRTSRLYKEGMLFDLTYFTEILDEVNMDRDTPKDIIETIKILLEASLKGENPVGPLVPTRLFLNTSSITPYQNLSSAQLNKFIVVYTTFNDREQGDKIVDILIGEKLIACANFLGIEAQYFWKNEIAKVGEVGALLKTKSENWEKVKAKIEELHSYEIPCIIKFDVESNKSYADWIKEETKINSFKE
jgi:periplasmic divalent cation tolerance protein